MGASLDNEARQPRGLVRVNGIFIPSWMDFEVDSNNHYAADTFRVRFPISVLPLDYDVTWFSAQTRLEVELFAGFPANPDNFQINELDSLILGRVDDVSLDMSSATLELTGRDLTAELIDAKTTEKFQNKKSSEIAQILAARHNLNAVVVPTGTPAGKFYEIDHAQMNSERSEWDLLSGLANVEDRMVYVRGRTLYFVPKPQPTDPPYYLDWFYPDKTHGYSEFTGKTLSFSRNLTLAKDIIVTVRSWNAKNKKGFSKTAKATHNKNTVLAGAAQPTGDAQTYQYNIPGLTPEQALQEAQRRLKQLSQHELKMTASMPADNVLDITRVIKVRGTETAFDTVYFPDSIVRTMSIQDGYTMTVSAKNHAPESQLIA